MAPRERGLTLVKQLSDPRKAHFLLCMQCEGLAVPEQLPRHSWAAAAAAAPAAERPLAHCSLGTPEEGPAADSLRPY